MFDMQVSTHLKGLAEKAKLNEKHVRIAWIYKAREASLTSELTELQERAQYMTEEVERLKSDLKHTTSARALAESREDEVQSSLTATEGELREVRDALQVAQNDLIETREWLKSAQSELQMVREELITSRGELRDLQVELRAANGDLNDKETQLEAACHEASEAKVLLETARRESSEAVNLAERLNEECRGLRANLHQRVSLVAQRVEVIRQLRDKPVLNGPLGGSLFNRKSFTRNQIWTSTSTSQATKRQRNLSLRTILKSLVLLLRPIPPHHRLFLLLTPEFLCSSLFACCRLLYIFFMYTRFLLSGLEPETYVAPLLINIHFLKICVLTRIFLFFFLNCMIRIEGLSN